MQPKVIGSDSKINLAIDSLANFMINKEIVIIS